MNNEKGFTLVELIAVITLMAIIGLMAFANLTNMMKEGEEREIESFETSVKNAAQLYVETNQDSDAFKNLQATKSFRISASLLVSYEYLDGAISNPTGYEFDNILVQLTKEDDDSISYQVCYRNGEDITCN